MLESAPRNFASFEAKQQYFDSIVAERENGGTAALMQMLLNYDTSGFCPTQRPMRSLESMVQQKLLAIGAVPSFVHDLLASGQEQTWPQKILRDELHMGFNAFCVQSGYGQSKLSHKLFINQLRLHAPSSYFKKVVKTRVQGGARKNAYEMPPLLQWRLHFEGALRL